MLRPFSSFFSLAALQATAMLLRLSVILQFLLVGFVCNANAQVNQIAGTSLYPEELIPLITRADALLTAGQFNDAAKVYSEAIGECKRYLVVIRHSGTGVHEGWLQS